MEGLEDHPHGLSSESNQFGRGCGIQRNPGNREVAGGRLIETAQETEQCTLPRSADAFEGDKLPPGYVQIDGIEPHHGRVADGVCPRQAVGGDGDVVWIGMGVVGHGSFQGAMSRRSKWAAVPTGRQ
jgi:hypothetical protein